MQPHVDRIGWCVHIQALITVVCDSSSYVTESLAQLSHRTGDE